MNKIKILSFICTSILLAGLHAEAQEKKNLSQPDAINYALNNSGELKIHEAKIEKAAAVVREAKDRKLPEATVSSSYLRLNKPNVDLKMKSSGSSSNGSSPHPSSAAYALANVSIPVYTASRIRYGIESAQFLEKAEKLDAENDKSAIILNTIEAYNNLYKAEAVVKLAAENLATAKERSKEFRDLEKNGLLPRNELMRAELQSSNAELTLVDAESNAQLANANMNLLLALPESTQLIVDSTFQTPQESRTLPDFINEGLKNRKDLVSLSYRSQAMTQNVKSALAGRYPSVALTAGYVAMDIPHVLTVTNAVNLGIGLQYSISSLWKNKAKVQQAEAEEKQLKATAGIASDMVKKEINEAWYNYQSAVRKINVLKLAVDLSNENYRIIKNKYNNKLATTIELLDADAAVFQAKLNLAFGSSDAAVAYAKLLHASGLLNNK